MIKPADIPNAPPTTANTIDLLYNPAANRTTLESLLELMLRYNGFLIGFNQENSKDYWPFRTMRLIEHIISVVFADGLSRCGSHVNPTASRFLGAWKMGDWDIAGEDQARSLVHIGEPKKIFDLPSILRGGNATKFAMHAYFTGYILTSQGWFDYFSITLLLLHIALVILHTAWVTFWGRTSESWDTIPELVALAQTSQPPFGSSLNNTCTGIRKLKTMGRVSWVESRAATGQSPRTSGGQEEIMLRFGEDGHKMRNENTTVKVGVKYGRMAM